MSRGVNLFIRALWVVGKGWLAYLAYVCDTSANIPSHELVLVVREFFDVFSTDLLSISSDYEIDFDIGI